MRRGIDQIPDYLYGGGYPDPLSNTEQVALLFFFHLIEGIDADNIAQSVDARHGRHGAGTLGGVFSFFTPMADRFGANCMTGARLVIDEPTMLDQVVGLVDRLRLDEADNKGELFEHVFKQIKQAGELGQFRTPRHVIRAMVRMIDPKLGETVCDPSA